MPSPQPRSFQPWSRHTTYDLRKRAGIKPLAMIPSAKWVKRGRNGEFTTGFGGKMAKVDDQPRINWIGVTANACERVGIGRYKIVRFSRRSGRGSGAPFWCFLGTRVPVSLTQAEYDACCDSYTLDKRVD